MKLIKCLVLAAALGMMAATGGLLVKVHRHTRLGAPGVKVGPGLLYDEFGHLAARHCVELPDEVAGFRGADAPVMRVELDDLPKDTTFGRKEYSNGRFVLRASVVLMGSDRTSIHQPQYCLEAQGWHIEETERVLVPMDRPYPYQLPVLKLTTAQEVKNKFNEPVKLKGIYVYWFVSADHLTSNQGIRMWSIARTMLEKGVLERWAYISYFAACYPGQEEATFEELEKFIRASAPEFQIAAGPPLAGRSPVASR